MSGLQWANKGFAAQFGWGGPNHLITPNWLKKLSNTSRDYKELRQQIANAFRIFDRDGPAPMPWPWLYGDAMNVPPAIFFAGAGLEAQRVTRRVAPNDIAATLAARLGIKYPSGSVGRRSGRAPSMRRPGIACSTSSRTWSTRSAAPVWPSARCARSYSTTRSPAATRSAV